MEQILLYWGGDERGNLFSGPAHDFPYCIPVGSQAPHAAGVAYAFKYRKEPRVAVCLFGDGATSKGDLWEAMNFAGVHKLPVVFVANNNQWAISVPLRLQTASETLAQKAIAAGFVGEQVDGNDVVAMRAASDEAIAAARSGTGPRFIEAMTYRLGDHTTADDAARYRPPEEVQARWKEEPIARLRVPEARRCRDRTIPGDRAAGAGDDVRPPLRRAPPRLCRPAQRGRGSLPCLT
jgi:pyruvate dehydrogenase E1 component alpha subunit